MARTRDRDIDERLLRATRELLEEVGYDDVSMAAVATRAGVGRPTLYRRWPTKADLVLSAVIGASVPSELPDTGSLAGDLVLAIEALIRSYTALPRPVLAAQLERIVADERFAKRVERELTEPALDAVVPIWERAVGRGEVDRDLDGREMLRDLAAIVRARVLERREDLDVERRRQLVARVVEGLRPQPAPPRGDPDARPTT